MKTLIRYLAPLLMALSLFGQSTPTVQVDTWAALKAIAIPNVPGKLTAIVKGRVSTNDGGGGTFFFTTGPGATDDGGTIATPNVGTGAWFRQYSGPVNLMWFGAVPDSSTDNRAAFTSALIFTNIYVPGAVGTYKVSSGSGLIMLSGTTISGDSAIASVIEIATGVPGLVVLSNCRVRRLTVRGTDNSANTSNIGILCANTSGSGATNVFIEDCVIEKCGGQGIDTGAVGGGWIVRNNIFRHNWASSMFAAAGTTNCIIEHNIFYNLPNIGVDLNGSYNQVIGNQFWMTGTNNNGVDVYAILIAEAQATGGAPAASSDYNLIQGNMVISSYGPGIHVTSPYVNLHCNFNRIVNNSVYKCLGAVGDGILVRTDNGSIIGTVIEGNTCIGNARYGISIDGEGGTIAKTTVKNNVVSTNSTGIIIGGATPPTDTEMIGNTYFGNTVLDMQDGGTRTVNVGNRTTFTGSAYYLGATDLVPITDNTVKAGYSTNRFADVQTVLLNGSPIPTGTITGTGTANTMAKFTGTSAVGNSLTTDDGTTINHSTFEKQNATDTVFSTTLALGATTGTPDVYLVRDAVNTPAFRNGTANQTLNVYSTSSAANANNERFEINSIGGVGAYWTVGAVKSGTGSNNRPVYLESGGNLIFGINDGAYSAKWGVQGSPFNLVPGSDATSTLGNATHRVNGVTSTIYTANAGSISADTPNVFSQQWNSGGVTFNGLKIVITNTAAATPSLPFSVLGGANGTTVEASIRQDGVLTTASQIISGGSITVPSGYNLSLSAGNAFIDAPAANQIRFRDSSATTAPTVQWGGTTASFPAMGRSTIYLTQTLADGTAGGGMQMSGLMNKYNNISTVSGGIPAEYGTVDLTAQTAGITATTLYTPAASGMFRISFVLHVTTAASVSSILSGTTGVVLTYNDGDGNVAQTFTMAMDDQTGAVIVPANGNTANTTQATCQGTAIIYAKAGVAINYAIGYTSAGTAMNYSVHGKCEAL